MACRCDALGAHARARISFSSRRPLALRARPRIEVDGQVREIAAILARRRLVEEPSESEDVGLRRAGPFRRNEAFRSDERLRLVGSGDQSDVGELGLSVDEDHVRRLDVAMHETMAMDVAQSVGELDAEREHLDQRQPPRDFRSEASVRGS